MTSIFCVGACYLDTILTVPAYPQEDDKLRASDLETRRGGNTPNTLEVLQQLIQSGHDDTTRLNLISVLPARDSSASEHIRSSLPDVNSDRCLYREDATEAASSYIIKSQATGSRTIVNYNELDEMTVAEFQGAVESIRDMPSDQWFHFEGRTPDVILQCIKYLRSSIPDVRISVEVEKPGRAGLQEFAAEADMVFYSKAWALAQGYESAAELLHHQRTICKTSYPYLLACTWGEEGAAAFDPSTKTVAYSNPTRIPPEQIVDTIGAGDTFIAGMLYGLILHPEDWNIGRKLEFATEIAQRKVVQEGFSGLGMQMRASMLHANEDVRLD